MGDNFLKKYIRIWWRSTVICFELATVSRLDFVAFVLGKLIRMGFFVVFVISLFSNAPRIAGYDRGEVLLFFAVMNLIDVLTQMIWYRGFTDFQRLIRTGDFDLVLAKPLSPLFWTAFRMFDLFDVATVPAAILFIGYALHELAQPIRIQGILLGSILLILSLLLAFAINLAIASVTFWTTELENAWWIYRDAIYVGRFPPEIFPKIIRVLFTFVIPILVIVTFPTKAFLGLLSPWMIAWAVLATILFSLLSLRLWQIALRHYASASA